MQNQTSCIARWKEMWRILNISVVSHQSFCYKYIRTFSYVHIIIIYHYYDMEKTSKTHYKFVVESSLHAEVVWPVAQALCQWRDSKKCLRSEFVVSSSPILTNNLCSKFLTHTTRIFNLKQLLIAFVKPNFSQKYIFVVKNWYQISILKLSGI